MLHTPMVGRDALDEHRASTPLELFFDLTFVVAVAQSAAALHEGLIDGRVRHALLLFPMTFFGVWWAWMNFTWFASAYDTDDIVYRVMVFVQMAGVLILAAGIPRAFDKGDFAVAVVGYVVMRMAMVSQWLRAAMNDRPRRACALRYAAGIALAQVGWVARLALEGGAATTSFIVLVLIELLIPVWAEAKARTTWHPRHVAERYGLFTLIVLGESVVAATVGVQHAIDANESLGDLVPVIVGGLMIVFAMWWIYFTMPRERAAEALRAAFDDRLNGAFAWGYGHYVVFGAVAATGAGLAVAVDQAIGHTQLSDHGAAAAVTVPVAVYLIVVWLLHRRHKAHHAYPAITPVAATLIIAVTFTPQPVLLTGVIVSGTLALALLLESRSRISTAA